MTPLGAYLRELRERQGLSLDELSRSTRVLHHYLEALEADDYGSLPAPVFARGFIRAYCQAVGVPPDEAIALYEQHVAPRRGTATSSLVAPPPPDQRARAAAVAQRQGRARGAVLVSFVLLVMLGAALYAVTSGLQSGHEADSGRPVEVATAPPAPAPDTAPAEPMAAKPPSSPPPPKAPSSAQPSSTLPSASPPSLPSAPAPAAAAPPAPAPPGPASSYRLVARTTETTWMSVRTQDGRTISEETIPAGQVREWVSNRPFVVSIGNAGGVALELNGQAFPQLGPSGAVIRRLTLPSENP